MKVKVSSMCLLEVISQEDPLDKEMATHSSILAWEIPWTEEPAGLQSMGSQRLGHNLAAKQQQEKHDLDGRVDSPALSGRGSRPSGRTSG